ncbi:MAG: hypothetical protein ACRD2I_07945 [Vicinamibacterales bacterium]
MVLGVIAVVGLLGALGDRPPCCGPLFTGWFVPTVLAVLTLVGISFLAAADRLRPELVAVFALLLALAVVGTELRQKYPAWTGHTFRAGFEAFHRQNFNQTESLLMANNVRKGLGDTLPVSGAMPKIDTYRMPGYAVFVALAGDAFRAPYDNLMALGRSAVYAQVWLFALALAVFACHASRVVGTGKAATMAAAAAWFPHSLDMTQGDSTIVACGLLITAALCALREKDLAAGAASVKQHVALHAAFALWFLMRSDILVAWLGVSVYLYRARARWLLLPLCMYLLLGLSWGLYKKAHGSDVVMSTSNVGHVAFVGLWQTPSHRFIWEPTDESYVKWIERNGYRYMDPKADRFATREVVRFWLTYPVFAATGVAYKLYSYCRYGAWAGSLALYPSRALGVIMRSIGWWCLLAGFALAVLMRYELKTVLLFGWPILLNLPIFVVLQYHARFLDFASCSLMFSAVVFGLDSGFYRRIGRSRMPLVAVLSVAIMLLASLGIARILPSDRFRYWTPLLDPAKSTLNVWRR